jgi:hypothetical protein
MAITQCHNPNEREIMSKPSTKPEPTTTEKPTSTEVVIQIADIVMAHHGTDKMPTLTAISRATVRAAGLLVFETREARTAAENAAAVQIARRSSLI